MSTIPLLISNPLIILNYIHASAALALSIFYSYKILSLKSGVQSANFSKGINYILLLSFFMIFFVLIYGFYYWFTDSSKVEPITAVMGLPTQEWFHLHAAAINIFLKVIAKFSLNIFFQSILISFFLIVWFLLRVFNAMKMKNGGNNN